MWPLVASEARDSSPGLAFCSHHFSVQITLVKSKISFPMGMFSSHSIRNALVFKQGLICRDVRSVQFRALRGRHIPMRVLGRGWDSPSSILLTEGRFQAQGAPFSQIARLTHVFLSQQQAERGTIMAEVNICTVLNKGWQMLLVKYCAISCYCLPMWMALSKGEFQITAHTVLFISGIYTALSFSQGTEIPTHHLQLQVLFHSIPGIRYSKCCTGPPVLQDIAPGLKKKGIRFIHLYSYGGKRKKESKWY